MNPNVIIKMIHDNKSDIILNFLFAYSLMDFRPSPFYCLNLPNGMSVSDVALCCACGKAILLTRCYSQ